MQLSADNIVEQTLLVQWESGDDKHGPTSRIVRFDDFNGGTFADARADLLGRGYRKAKPTEYLHPRGAWEAYIRKGSGLVTLVVIEA